MNIGNPMITFAQNLEGRMVHVDDVFTGLNCECICPGCKSRLMAKNAGREKAHHFAHESGANAISCAETALHLAAKQIIQDYRRIKVPIAHDSVTKDEMLTLVDVQLEHRIESSLGSVVLDCFASTLGESIGIEIAVHHQVDEFKANKLKLLQLKTLEIDLKDMLQHPWSWSDLEDAVLLDLSRRQWIVHDEPSPEPPTSLTPATEPLLPTKSWLFYIAGIRVWVNKLPYNYKVQHVFDEQTRKIVEPICRGRGRWDGKYNNWIIYDRFISQVLAELDARQSHFR